MNTSRITAEAIIKGVDETGAAFKAIQGKIDSLVAKFGQVGKAAAISGQIDKLNASLKKTQDQLAGVQKLQGAEERLARLGARYAQEKARAEEQANARTAASAQRAAASYYKQLDAVNALRRNLEGAGLAVNHLASEEARLRGAIDGTSAAIARQGRALAQAALREEHLAERQNRIRHGARETGRHLLGSTMGMAGGIGAGYATIRGTELAAEKGAEYQAALNRVRNVANNEDEVRLAGEIATKASAANPYTTRTQAIEDYVELRSLAVSNKPGEAINREAIERNVLLMSKARAALASSGYQLEGGEAKSLAQALEGSGRAMDPNAQFKMLDAYVRAKQVFGNAIQASSVRDFVQNAKSANFSMSDESFFGTVMARLAQGNASRLGNEFSQTMQTIVGGHMTKAGAEWLAKTGIINPDQIRSGGGGKFYIAGKAKEQDLLSTDVTAWAQQVLYPGIEKAGGVGKKEIEGRVEMLRKGEMRANPNAQIDMHALEERAIHGLVADFISKSGFKPTVTDNFAHAIANAFQIQKDKEQMHQAKGLDASETLGQNPVAAWQEMGSAISSFVGALTGPAAGSAGEVLHSMAGGISGLTASLAEWQKQHPELANSASVEATALATGAVVGVPAGAVAGYMTGTGLVAGGAIGGAAGLVLGGSLGGAYMVGEEGERRAKEGDYSFNGIDGPPDPFSLARKLKGSGATRLPDDAAFASIPPSEFGSGLNLANSLPARRRIDYVPNEGSQFGTGLFTSRGGSMNFDLGSTVRSALEGLKATVDQPVPVDVTGKLEPVKLEGSADVRVAISISGDGKVTSEHASSSGNIRASVSTGRSMQSPHPGAPPGSWME